MDSMCERAFDDVSLRQLLLRFFHLAFFGSVCRSSDLIYEGRLGILQKSMFRSFKKGLMGLGGKGMLG